MRASRAPGAAWCRRIEVEGGERPDLEPAVFFSSASLAPLGALAGIAAQGNDAKADLRGSDGIISSIGARQDLDRVIGAERLRLLLAGVISMTCIRCSAASGHSGDMAGVVLEGGLKRRAMPTFTAISKFSVRAPQIRHGRCNARSPHPRLE